MYSCSRPMSFVQWFNSIKLVVEFETETFYSFFFIFDNFFVLPRPIFYCNAND